VRPLQYKAQTTPARVARIIAALTLVLALLSGIAPPGSLALAAPVSECSMSCCIGKPPHAAGHGAADSCHVELPAHDAHGNPHDGAHEHQHDAAPSLQTPGHQARHDHASQPQTPAHDAHSDGAATHQANTHPAWHAPETGTNAAPQTEAGEPESEAVQPAHRHSAAAHASVARPCPSGCGMAAGNVGNNLRVRDASTLAHARRLQPPARAAALKHSSTLPLTSSDKRRLAPPRAPPVAL
jgi:hypothetical protein